MPNKVTQPGVKPIPPKNHGMTDADLIARAKARRDRKAKNRGSK